MWGAAPAESETPPSLTREHRGLFLNCVPQYNQGYDRNNIPGNRNIIPGYFRWLLGGGLPPNTHGMACMCNNFPLQKRKPTKIEF